MINRIFFFLFFSPLISIVGAFFIPVPCLADSPRQISVVYCTNIAPFEYTDEKGNPEGLIIDFWKLWSKKTGIRVNFKKALWNDTLEMVAKGKADAHAGLFYNKKRDAYLDYGTTLSKTTTHIFFHKTIAVPDRFEKISAYRIGVIEDDFVEGYLKKLLPSAPLTGYKDYQTLTSDLKSGKLKIFAADTATGLYYLSQKGLLPSFHLDNANPLYESDWYVASKEGNKAMLDLINSGMEKITPKERKKIERRWTSGAPSDSGDALIIAVSRNYPPFTSMDTKGDPTGFLIDLWQEWAKLTDTPIKFRATNWADTLSSMKAGYADIHSGLFINQDRESWLEFSSPFIEVETALFFKSEVPLFPLVKMAGKKVGVIKDTYQDSFIKREYPNIQVVTYSDIYDLVRALLQERIQAAGSEVPKMMRALHRLGISGSVTQGAAFLSNTIHAGILKNNKRLLDIVNQGFASMPEETFSMIKERWFPRIPNWKMYLKWIVAAAVVIVMLIIIGLLWNYKLRNELVLRREMERVLEDAKKQAESASRAKSTFLANMSHEIRTPMNAILGMNRLALETDLTNKQDYLLKTVQTSSEHLLRLLDDILDFSKIEAGKLEIQHHPFSLSALFNTLFSAMNSHAKAKGLKFETRIKDAKLPDYLVGDEFRIRQILFNLITNAIKFTDQGTITVIAKISKKQNTPDNKIELLFSVSDTGMGIVPEKQEIIFSSFQQADSSIARGFGGTGLGLTICRQLTHLLGGKIWLKSTPKVGTCFFFTLPLGVGDRPVQEDLEKESVRIIQNLKILLVEDNSINQDLAKMVLEKDHHKVIIAENGLDGLKLLACNNFDIIFMDIQMPVMDGLTACKIIRAIEKEQAITQTLSEKLVLDLKNNLIGRYLPIVAMTANAMGEGREKCFQAGMDGYITKPFHFELIRKTLVRLTKESLIKTGEEHIVDTLPREDKKMNQESEHPIKDPIKNQIRNRIEIHLRTIYLLGDEQIDHMLVTATKTLSDNISTARTALKNTDYKKLGEAAHSIKGSLFNIGLDDIATTAKKIEINAKENIETDFHKLLKGLCESLADLLEDN
jgi:signal transduction histidine kinase/CheY-like chemotaxis protein/HPt (histidine-containing phosphotransfer) domain-containing protein